MTPEARPSRLLVIGGMNLDILGVAGGAWLAGDSMPGAITQRPGGVGRNIASGLVALGAQVELLCALGNDQFSVSLRAACQAEGIGLGFALSTPYPSPTYLAIHDASGEMVSAVNDMRAMDALTPQAIGHLLPSLGGFDACVLDANLREDSLQAAARIKGMPLVADPVSAAKCRRLLPILHRLTALKPNRLEAEALTGETAPQNAAAALLARGVRMVFISLGAEGLYYADAALQGSLRAPSLPPSSRTGAGDAMTAGLALAISQGLPVREAALLGLEAATRFLSGHGNQVVKR